VTEEGELTVKVLQTLILVSGSVVLAGLLGCSDQPAAPQTVYVAQPQPAEQPQPVAEPQYIIVREAPPPIIVESRPPPPDQGHIWIEGYWNWNGHKYDWQIGRWAAPPHERAIWVAPRYEKHEQGYRYMPGRWHEEQRQEQQKRAEEPRRDRR
jgi:hypothetical protein